jgi:hypothetical protein
MKKVIYIFSILMLISSASCSDFGSENPYDNPLDSRYSGDTYSGDTAVTYALRDTGPAGGLIFYDKGYYSNGWWYLEAASPTTLEKDWGKIGTEVTGTGTAIGTGANNTALIVAKLNEVPAASDKAAQFCDALIEGGYDDWFLPSKDELNEMYNNLHLHGVGDFANLRYSSSSEADANNHSTQIFTDGSQNDNGKNIILRFRAARAF